MTNLRTAQYLEDNSEQFWANVIATIKFKVTNLFNFLTDRYYNRFIDVENHRKDKKVH